MPRVLSHSNVPPKGFSSFISELERPPWSLIPAPDPTRTLFYEPIIVVQKVRVYTVVNGVMIALGVSNEVIEADRRWERGQKKLNAKSLYDLYVDNLQRVAAAERVRETLLLGDGLGQNALDLDLEVDHGLMQVGQCKEDGPRHDDIVFLGYLPEIEEIRETTMHLAKVIGRDLLTPRPAARSLQIQEATRTAAKTFDSVRENLEHLLTQLPEGSAEHIQVKQLLLTMTNLLDRFTSGKPSIEDKAPAAESPPVVVPAPAAPVANNLGGNPFID